MKQNLTEELFKLIHQKTLLYGIATLLVLTFYNALTSRINTTQIIFSFGSVQWIPIILIATGSALFSMEYQDNTIIMLLYKNSQKWKIYSSKLFMIWLYSITLIIISVLFTFILKALFVNNMNSWFTVTMNNKNLVSLLLFNALGTLIYSIFIVRLSFMLIMLIKMNVAVIGIGLAIGFLGAGFSVALMTSLPELERIIRWNPLNMIFITQQLVNPKYIKISHLSNFEIIIGILIYSFIFTYIGYQLFKHRRI